VEHYQGARGDAWALARASTTTDAEGRFVLSGLDPAPYRISVMPPTQSLPVALVRARAPESGELAIRVPEEASASATIALRALAPDGGPAAKARVEFVQITSGAKLTREVGADGRFESPKIPPGEYRVRLRSHDRGDLDLGLRTLARGEDIDLGDVRFPEPARVTVALGKGSSKALAAIFDRVGPEGDRDTVYRLYLGAGREGTAVLSPGRYALRLQGFDVAGAELSVEVGPGEAGTIPVDPKPAPARRFEVRPPADTKGRAILLEIRDARDRVVFRHVVEREDPGAPFPGFEAPLLSGHYTVGARAAGERALAGSLDVPAGEPGSEPLPLVLR
jgi:hypothetical protein